MKKTREVLFVLFFAAAGAAAGAAQDLPVLEVGLDDAVRIALGPEGNARLSLARESVAQVESRSSAERAAFLPNLSGSVTEQSRTTNLKAMGIDFDVPVPGFETPGFVGPFETFDARARVTQSLLDWGTVERYRASRVAIDVAESMSAATRNEVAAMAAGAYTRALEAAARVEAARADLALAESLLELADSQREAGTGTAIEVTRARVELANQRQLLLSAESDSRKTRLELLQVLNLSLDTPLVLADDPGALPIRPVDLADPLQTALGSREDFQAQRGREEQALRQYDAVRAERWPSIYGLADYGALGASPADSRPTRSIGIDLRVPIFDGGRRQARASEAQSQLDQERIRTDELQRSIELEVRLAMDEIQTARAQVEVSAEGLGLASEELERAERRYRAGVTTNVELVGAQARLERARENAILAGARLHLAEIELGRATGTVEELILGP